jgi:hypothetical protein
MWKLVQTTVDQKGPLMDKVRQGLFSYRGSEPSPAPRTETALYRFCGRVAAETKAIATGDFPIFSRLAMRMQDRRAAALRQALAFWSYQIEKAEPDERLVILSACLELAKLAHVIQAEVIGERENNHWANSLAVMCGNYLLTKAFSAIQPLGHDLTGIVAGAAGRLCRDEIDSSLDADEEMRVQRIAQIEGAFFGAATQLATRLAGCSPFAQDRLESFGRILGKACKPGHSASGPVLRGSIRIEAERALTGLPESKAKLELLTLDWTKLLAV